MSDTMTAPEYLQQQYDATSEKEFQDDIVRKAKQLGWLCYHTYDSRRSEPGFPDLVIVRPAEYEGWSPIIFAELKRESRRLGKVTVAQQAWLDALDSTLYSIGGEEGYCIVEVWRPSDIHRIEALLQGRRDWRTA